MSISYASPGVYVQEIAPTAIQPIEAVGTSMPAFIGITQEASIKKVNARTGERSPLRSVLNQPVLVETWTKFTQVFGGFVAGAYLPDAVYFYFASGGGPCYVVSLRALSEGTTGGAAATVSIPSKGRTSFTVSAKTIGEAGNGLAVTITNDVDEAGKSTGTFRITVRRANGFRPDHEERGWLYR
ncbi:MAG: hypothetical protein V9G20_26710 [Candidatus Promineifilaceae bacterium]